jgi:hypothetical protein
MEPNKGTPMNWLLRLAKGLVIYLLIILTIKTLGSLGKCKNMASLESEFAQGVVIEKYIDRENHSAFSLKLTNNEIYRIFGFGSALGNLEGIYNSIAIGDSLYKAKGSINLIIYKEDGRQLVFTHDTGCNKEWWMFWK